MQSIIEEVYVKIFSMYMNTPEVLIIKESEQDIPVKKILYNVVNR